MEYSLRRWRVVAALLLSVYLPACHAQQCNENDNKALLEFKAGFTPQGFFNIFESWKAGTNCCQWNGVNCTSSGRVNGLLISNPNIHGGPSPAAERNVSYNGVLGATLGDLSELRILDLSYILFNGPMPDTFGKLKQLERLTMFYNNFSGSLSPSIGGATSLKNLDVSGASYFLSSPGLKPGPIPPSFCQLRNLQTLRLVSFNLTGHVSPCFCNFNQLESLELTNNRLAGGIPSCIGSGLGKLSFLGLSGNELTGDIPSEIGNLVNLQFLDLSDNSLSGSIPPAIGNLAVVTALTLSNNRLEGKVPSEIANCGTNSSGGFVWLEISNNRLSGSIPDIFGGGIIQTFSASRNRFTGGFPLTLAKVHSVDVSYNSLSDLEPVGTLPPAPSVEYLYMGNNAFSGAVPSWLIDLVASANVTIFDISVNKFTGPIPAVFLENVWNVNASYNMLTGQLPTVSSLQSGFLGFSHNRISGPITSAFIGSLLSTTYLLDLSFNQLSGPLPANSGDFLRLDYLDLSDNQLTGEVPASIEKIPTLDYLDLSHNNFTGRVPSKGHSPAPAAAPV
ncbi:hypothetical protein R1flu_023484 [Riccia fluitans]|uniref:Leucine-rich repeat-containing N-terminal plant-type domain-containing protein n=1 Tax=Riccia fluitans TaxID=41844 RepID=A0ABD1XS65_9MARC